MRKSWLLLLALLASGCATVRSAPEARWSYKASGGEGPNDGPLALLGYPDTMAFNVFRCNAAERTLDFEDIEAEAFEGGRPIHFEVGGQRWSGEQRMDPPDGVPVARARLPLDSPLVSAIAAGVEPIRVAGPAYSGDFPNHRVIGRVIRECRALASGN